MCVMITKTADKPWVSKKELAACYDNNPDGAGYAYYDRDKNRIRVAKGYFNFGSLYKDLKELGGCDVLLHFRQATHGKVSKDNCHPFILANGTVMAHNGIIHGITPFAGKTDSETFGKTYLEPFTAKELKGKALTSLMEFLLGGNKVALMLPGGELIRYNESSGVWHEGLWFSNESYKPRMYSSQWYYPGTDWDYDSNTKRYTYRTTIDAAAGGGDVGRRVEEWLEKHTAQALLKILTGSGKYPIGMNEVREILYDWGEIEENTDSHAQLWLEAYSADDLYQMIQECIGGPDIPVAELGTLLECTEAGEEAEGAAEARPDAPEDEQDRQTAAWLDTHTGADLVNALAKMDATIFDAVSPYTLLLNTCRGKDIRKWLRDHTAQSFWGVLVASDKYTDERLALMYGSLAKVVKEDAKKALPDAPGNLVEEWFERHSGVSLTHILLQSGPKWFDEAELDVLLRKSGYNPSKGDGLNWLDNYTARSWWEFMVSSGRYEEEHLDAMRRCLEKAVKEEVCSG